MSERLGATPHEDGSCSLLVWAPRVERIDALVRASAREDRSHRVRLERGEHGYHRARLEGIGAGARYALVLDGDDDRPLPDPASAAQPDGVHGASEVVDHGAFAWQVDGWAGVALRDFVIYELHVGTFTPEGTFAAAAERLGELAELGVTAVELLPVAQFPGDRNWGYDGVDPFAPQSTYGGPDGLRRFVDAAHAAGIAVVLDVVYNHLGPEGNHLARFGPYFSDRHHTPWGEAVNVDGPGSDEVRRFFIENALQWLRDYRIDALRLDAIHGIVDTSAYPFLAELADRVAELERATGVPRFLIAESDLNDVRVITTRADDGLGSHAQWTDDLHHALHVTLTGETSGYYVDFAGGIEDLATTMRRAFKYVGQRSEHRDRRFGSDPTGIPPERFVVYAQNHDQVGNRLLGDRLSALVDDDLQHVALAAVLLSPFTPMLFMGEEYGETRPFPYFVSHTDPALVAAVRKGRKAEFAHFGFTGTAPDPQGEETFRSAILDWDARSHGRHAALLAFTRELLRLRREHPSIRSMPEPEDVTVSGGMLSIERSDRRERTRLALDVATGSVVLEQLEPTTVELLRHDGARSVGGD